ncbi:putative GNAT family N-acetyltransferase [Oenococcus oeni]|uniref:GNAT family N-acetyltransferase n=1 Tax=Oenococcus oeni TaxID=1247 RepID=UPI00107992A0|nr:GNAT family N-acetyltransferase [Oenococcus oeni]AVI94512.1 acetyltransferase [Oenococcus oeni]SYW00682.1 putative GNAT family N-acetyltransferase [Oenococcus oeni]SYW02631.1 putative GNAT family N-acetyltransferase [Oenococcus oeni]SYW19063.1 putative GNAT family N-acetyltransferase [Oenococcus oeni]VDC15092.1 putative GNAT family N-acetyltransferase [Oenococcus oeni]
MEQFKFFKFGTEDQEYYRENLVLRNEVLRKTIGKNIFDDDLEIEKNNLFYGITIHEHLIATFSLFDEELLTAHLAAFAVKKDFQKQGLGSRLLKYAIDDLRNRGYKQIKTNARTSAHGFYLKNGFKDLGRRYHNSRLGINDYSMVYVL